jgi:uncharacterized protein YjiS (DUF1127 family)
MKHRAHFTKKERQARSSLIKIAGNYGLLRGSIYVMKHKCGKPGCKCNYGEKHLSVYLSQNKRGKTKLTYLPNELQKKANKWVLNYKRTRRLLDEISEECLKRLIKEKEAVKKIS